MKKILLIFLFLSTSSSFAQYYRDKIITTNNDTIACRITLINKFEIFYDSKKHGEKLIYISRDKVSSVILDSTSKPSINDVDLNKTISNDKSKTLYVFSDASLKDSTYSPLGIYVSMGIGESFVKDLKGFGGLFSCSMAYNTNLLTFTYMGCSTFDIFGPLLYGIRMHGNYKGVLLGKAIRNESSMVSASIGLAVAEVNQTYFIRTSSSYGYYDSHIYNGISFPIELKCFFLAEKVLGIGLHYSLNITPLYCPSTITLSLVFGAWNIER